MRKKVFITGITGMVGSHLADFLFENTDWEIHGLIRWRSNLENINSLIPHINKKNRIYLHYGDIREQLSLRNILKNITPDYCFHLAAQSYPQTSFSSPIDTFETNANGTYNILDTLKDYAPECITHVCSSSEVFGKVSKEKLPISEDCSFHPASPYAISKVSTDLIGRYFYESYNLNVQITRMFTHTGPRRGDVFAESTFAKQIAMIEMGLQENKIYVGNLNSLRTIADVRDAVEAYYLLLTMNPSPGETYNIGGNYSCTIREILDHLIKISNLQENVDIIIDQTRIRPIDADLQIPNTKKFVNKTGWKPKYSFKDTMRDLLDYWRNKINSKSNFLLR